MNSKGITLLELLVVIVIIGLVGAFGSIGLSRVLNDSQEQMLVEEAKLINSSVELYCQVDTCNDTVDPNDLHTYNGQANIISIEFTDNGIRLEFSLRDYKFKGYALGTENNSYTDGGYDIVQLE